MAMKKVILTIASFLFFHVSFAQTFTLKSTELGGQAIDKQVFNGFGCTGQNVSPQLNWNNAPEGTKSFAITLFDATAPTGSGWWHWLVFDIPNNCLELKSGAGTPNSVLLPQNAIQSLTDFKSYGYGGPCPPIGNSPHQYILTIYALKTNKLGLEKDANPALVGFMLNQQTIQKASLVFYYSR
jgi:Raf kinase inhibitor-like YbhB/YbcL family protein